MRATLLSKKLVALDNEAPRKKLPALLALFGGKRSVAEVLLVALHEIDNAFEQQYGCERAYVCGDASLLFLLPPIEQSAVIKSLLALNDASLVFRFTCAKKFLIRDSSLKQLRISSWGKEHIRTGRLMIRYAPLRAAIRKTIRSTIRRNESTYRTLMALLSSGTITPTKARRIVALNKRLPLKIVC